jgi:uncharacterized protein
MKNTMRTLLEVQTLEMKPRRAPGDAERLEVLRDRIPAGLLDRYDRLRARGKTGVASVRHETCSGCHMRVRLATLLALQHGDTPQSCDNCSRYLYLDEQPEAAPVKPARKRKAALAKA